MSAPRLSAQAITAAATAEALARRDAAVARLAALIDPMGALSTWARAGRIAAACRQLPPAPPPDGSPFESALWLVREVGPAHQRRLADLLAELGC